MISTATAHSADSPGWVGTAVVVPRSRAFACFDSTTVTVWCRLCGYRAPPSAPSSFSCACVCHYQTERQFVESCWLNFRIAELMRQLDGLKQHVMARVAWRQRGHCGTHDATAAARDAARQANADWSDTRARVRPKARMNGYDPTAAVRLDSAAPTEWCGGCSGWQARRWSGRMRRSTRGSRGTPSCRTRDTKARRRKSDKMQASTGRCGRPGPSGSMSSCPHRSS